jgi:hypothetical protein
MSTRFWDGPACAARSKVWRVIDGVPRVGSEIALATREDAGRATSLAVATLLLNSVPTVVALRPGQLDSLTIPPHGGGYFDRSA